MAIKGHDKCMYRTLKTTFKSCYSAIDHTYSQINIFYFNIICYRPIVFCVCFCFFFGGDAIFDKLGLDNYQNNYFYIYIYIYICMHAFPSYKIGLIILSIVLNYRILAAIVDFRLLFYMKAF